ncbi:MAG: hypothetical protein ACK5H4_20300 [Lacrimispora sphenoides]
MKTGAVIFAAGYKCAASTFIPSMPIGGTTVIRRIIMTLKRSGVDQVVVRHCKSVSGMRRDLF